MRRVNEKRKEIPKENVKNIRKEINQNINIKSDILYILRHYEKRIHFFNQSEILKKFLRTKLIYTEKIPFDINLDFYKNLKSLVIKFTKIVDLGYFNNKKLQSIDLNAIDQIKISNPIQVERLRILNSDIEIETFTKILENETLKSLSLINCNIYSKHDLMKNKDIINLMNSNSDEFCEVQSEDLDIEDVTNLYHEDVVNSKICNIFHTLNLKKLTLIETNIKLETVKSSGILEKLNTFKFKNKSTILIYSFAQERCSFLKTNQDYFLKPNLPNLNNTNLNNTNLNNTNLNNTSLPNLHNTNLNTLDNSNKDYCMSMVDIECLIIPNTKLLFKDHDFSNLKILSLSNSAISNELMELIGKRFLKCEEFSFLNCSFTDVSFTRFLNMFGRKVRYLNLIDSDLPFDALTRMKATLVDCKIVFRDKRVFKLKK